MAREAKTINFNKDELETLIDNLHYPRFEIEAGFINEEGDFIVDYIQSYTTTYKGIEMLEEEYINNELPDFIEETNVVFVNLYFIQEEFGDYEKVQTLYGSTEYEYGDIELIEDKDYWCNCMECGKELLVYEEGFLNKTQMKNWFQEDDEIKICKQCEHKQKIADFHTIDCVCGDNIHKGYDPQGVMRCENCDIDGKNYEE